MGLVLDAFGTLWYSSYARLLPMQANNPLELTLNQSFEKERFSRAIEESSSIEDLKKISKVLLDGWFTQRAASQWLMKQALSAPAKVTKL